MQLNDDVLPMAVGVGLCEAPDGCPEIIEDMLRLAVPFTHPKGNLRYADYVFRVEGSLLVYIGMIRCEYCNDKKYVLVQEACEDCDGDGCAACKHKGSRLTKIPCQDCKKS